MWVGEISYLGVLPDTQTIADPLNSLPPCLQLLIHAGPDIDKEALLRRELTPPLQMSSNNNEFGFDSRGFNMRSNQQDLQETVLPQAKMDNLMKNQNAFQDFERQGADLSQPGRVPHITKAKPSIQR